VYSDNAGRLAVAEEQMVVGDRKTASWCVTREPNKLVVQHPVAALLYCIEPQLRIQPSRKDGKGVRTGLDLAHIEPSESNLPTLLQCVQIVEMERLTSDIRKGASVVSERHSRGGCGHIREDLLHWLVFPQGVVETCCSVRRQADQKASVGAMGNIDHRRVMNDEFILLLLQLFFKHLDHPTFKAYSEHW
jgi:hypothetical protein